MAHYLHNKLERARNFYAWRKYDVAYEILVEVISKGDSCPNQVWWNKVAVLFEADKRECFRLLGDKAREAISNLEHARSHGYTSWRE